MMREVKSPRGDGSQWTSSRPKTIETLHIQAANLLYRKFSHAIIFTIRDIQEQNFGLKGLQEKLPVLPSEVNLQPYRTHPALSSISLQPMIPTISSVDYDQMQVSVNKDFLVDPGSLDWEEARYVLETAEHVLSIAEHIQKTIHVHQLDCAKFVALYKDKNNWVAQTIVNQMLGGYIASYENLANRMSLLMCPGPSELPQLQEWLWSPSVLTDQRKLRNACAHEANVKPPLKNMVLDRCVFQPEVFFNFVEKEIPLLIEELPRLIADLEKNMQRFPPPVSSPPDNLQTINARYAEDLLLDDNTDFVFNDLHQRMNKALELHNTVDRLLERVNSQELDLRQQVAYVCSAKFTVVKEEFHIEACEIRRERNERAAEIVEARNEQLLTVFQNLELKWNVDGTELSNFDWGVDPNAEPWASDGWTPVSTDGDAVTQSTVPPSNPGPSTRSDIIPQVLLSQALSSYPALPSLQQQHGSNTTQSHHTAD